jgi:signal transduction histidine kinase
MVEQILGFAGIQSGRIKYEMQPVDVEQIIARAMSACEPEILASGCELETRIETNLPLVSGDPTSLTHCLRNLIDNAARYGRAGDWIGVFAKTASGAKGTEIEIRIEDHGPGIEPREMVRIFDPFYRGQKSVEDQIHGFGLGLALVKRIVAAHSGTIAVDSTPGEGTSFTIRIPANVQVAESTEIAAIAGTEYGGTAHSAD